MPSPPQNVDRSARAELRFRLYCFAERDLGVEAMGFRDDVRLLFAEGKKARQELHTKKGCAPRRQQELVERLERAADGLARSDDWSRRLQTSFGSLQAREQVVITQLVKLGCVPDPLIECWDAHRTQDASQDLRREVEYYRPVLVNLSKQMTELADACEHYLDGDWRYLGSKFPLKPELVERLRSEAGLCETFIGRIDLRFRDKRTKPEVVLLRTMEEIKVITGEYQDALISQMLEGSRGSRSAETLKRWRSRQVRKWGAVTRGRTKTNPLRLVAK